MEPLQPPAIVRAAESKAEMASIIKKFERAICEQEGAALRNAIAQGKWLNKFKLALDHGEWLPELEKLGIHRRRAAERMKLARHEQEIVGCKTIREALELVGEPEEEAATLPPGTNIAPGQTQTSSNGTANGAPKGKGKKKGPREPGDPSRTVKPQSGGNATVDMKEIENSFGKLVRAITDANKSIHTEAVDKMRELLASFAVLLKEFKKGQA